MGIEMEMELELERYCFPEAADTLTPQLIYYRDIIEQNTRLAIRMAGGAERLWPHVKSHKTADLVRLQMKLGITRFKCATIAEAEMLAGCGAPHILLAYPLVGPAVERFLRLQKAHPESVFWAIGDNGDQLARLGKAAVASGCKARVLLDVNMGMDRTGIPLDQVVALYAQAAAMEGLVPMGLHCYDGHHNDKEIAVRCGRVEKTYQQLEQIRAELEKRKLPCDIMVMGGTPSFPCYCDKADAGLYLSPGTAFLTDYGYMSKLPDLEFLPAAVLLTRVISHPTPESFTLDLGYKGISVDQGAAGVVVGLGHCVPRFQSEEHWVFHMDEGFEPPPVGSFHYVVPMHVCPTSALYSEVLVVAGGHPVGRWQVTARDRMLRY